MNEEKTERKKEGRQGVRLKLSSDKIKVVNFVFEIT